ncbi:MAG: AAA family ATPase [Nitrospirae bacterium]|nr:AAA family ATPase [Nitrospirota bacterium]
MMLKQLHIKDFALVDELTLTFEDGLCVITGETGAGKSILIGALEILLGAKAHPDLIRAQCEEAVVEGVFGLEGPPRESVHPAQSDGTIQLRRRLSREGRGRIQINGETRTLAQLEGLGRGLVGLYGQHEYMDLALPARQLAYLDDFAGLDEDARAVEDRRQAASRLYTELRDFDRLARTRAERIDLLTYQTGEIERGQVKPGEDEALEAEVRIMANSEKMASTLGEVEQALYSSDEAVVGKIGKSVQAVRPLTQIDPRLGSTADALASAQSLVQEAARDLSGYLSRLEFDPSRLEAAQQRLHDLDRLKKKYGGTLDRVLRTLEEGRAELEKLSTAAEDREEVARRFGQAWIEFVASCEDLLKRRHLGARKLAREIEAGCGAVGLAKAAFSVEVAAAWPETGGGKGRPSNSPARGSSRATHR